MTRRRIQNILRKEWELLFTDVNSALFVTLLPLLIVGQGMLYIWLAITFGGETILGNPMFQSALEHDNVYRYRIRGSTAIPGKFCDVWAYMSS